MPDHTSEELVDIADALSAAIRDRWRECGLNADHDALRAQLAADVMIEAALDSDTPWDLTDEVADLTDDANRSPNTASPNTGSPNTGSPAPNESGS